MHIGAAAQQLVFERQERRTDNTTRPGIRARGVKATLPPIPPKRRPLIRAIPAGDGRSTCTRRQRQHTRCPQRRAADVADGLLGDVVAGEGFAGDGEDQGGNLDCWVIRW
jgi:hypothetical protein